MMRLRWTAVLGACALALACGASAPPPAGDAQLAAIDAERLAPFLARVEAARGLRFRAPVAARRVPPAALRPLLARELDRALPPDRLAAETELAASLGLVPANLDLRAAVLDFEVEGAAGFYSPLDDRLYVVDGAASAGGESEEALLVHELTHALQAQHGAPLEAMAALEGDDDLAFALAALLEGEATWVELADAEAHGRGPRPAPGALAARFSADALAPQLPRALAEAFVAPYPLGYALADALVARGGVRALDAAHADPPLTSEELLHPERYLDRARRAPLAELARDPRLPGCRVVATNCLGELGVRVWLAELGAAESAAAAAADGWEADRAWRLACGARRASAWLLEYASEAEAAELAAALGAPEGRAGAAAELAVEREGARVLVSRGLRAAERRRLAALAAPRRFARLADYLAAHPELAARLRELRR